jgi:hypothetical protein
MNALIELNWYNSRFLRSISMHGYKNTFNNAGYLKISDLLGCEKTVSLIGIKRIT